jgi:hypothetical protein
MAYAHGLLDHHWRNIVRSDGMIRYRAEEVAQQARMLTILATYFSYSGGDGAAAGLLLTHFDKAKAMAGWLMARRTASLRYGPDEPRHGIPPGTDEGDDFKVQYTHQTPQSHWYASAAEAYRAFAELGAVWVAVGRGAARRDVVAHGEELLAVAPLLYRDLHTSLNRTATPAAAAGGHCWPAAADQPTGSPSPTFRGHAAMLWSGALSSTQLEDIYAAGTDAAACGARTLALGSPAEAGAVLTTASPFGLASQLVRNGACPRWPQRPSFSASFPEGPGHTLLPRSAAHRLSGASAGAVLPARKRSQGERSPPARL